VNVTKLDDHLFLIDVEAGGEENFIASYVLKGKEVAIIETGPTSSVPNVLRGLEKLNVKPEDVTYIAVSHIHLDHGGGIGRLLKHLPNAKVVVHRNGASHLIHPNKLWRQAREILGSEIADLYEAPERVPSKRIIPATDGMTFDIGNEVTLQVITTLGHASHHQSYLESAGGLFPGDAAGIYLKELDVVVPTAPPPFRLKDSLSSLDKLIALRPKIMYYSHFGPSADPVQRLEAYADQLRLWGRIAAEGLELQQNLKTVRERIFQTDSSFKIAEPLIKAHPILRVTVLNNSIRGFVESAKQLKLKELAQF
jgi:glyoxylase-like metal-dependent hydrolase (beta-lactamase superfamily II)